MIIKNGIDILNKNRIKRIFLSKLLEKFKKKILSQNEILDFNKLENDIKKISFLSNRFSVKESIAKAIGCGIQNKYLIFRDLEISKDAAGAPFLIKNKALNDVIELFFQTKNYSISISISDEMDYSISGCVIILIPKQ